MERAEKALKEDFVPNTPIEKAIDYVAREFGVVAKTKVKALNEAHKNGVDFPNLK